MNWKLKIDPETKAPIVTEDGKIMYIDPDGKELPLNPPAMYRKITELNGEAKGHREKKEELAAKLESFKDIEDLPEWKKKADEALQAVANFNDKDWMKAEKVETLKKDITAAYEEKLKQAAKAFEVKEKAQMETLLKKDEQVRRLLISSKFATSKYFSGGGDKSVTILPSGIAEDHFGKYFKVEEDASTGMPATKAYYANGDPVLSKLNPGEPAEFEEAIGLIIDNYPGKDSILRSTGGGSGGSGGSGSGASGDGSDLGQLKKQYAEALKSGNGQMAVTLRNKIFTLERKLKATG